MLITTMITIALFCITLSIIILAISFTISMKSEFDFNSLSPFECGFSPLSPEHNLFSQRFFVVALMFVIFDVEVIILLPFTITQTYMTQAISLNYFIIFLLILTLGLINEWNQGMLEWAK